jgi:hypothetical protein
MSGRVRSSSYQATLPEAMLVHRRIGEACIEIFATRTASSMDCAGLAVTRQRPAGCGVQRIESSSGPSGRSV